MNKNTLFFFVSLLIVQMGNAQTVPCGTVSTKSIDYGLLLSNKSLRNQGSTCVDIQFHILQDLDGNNAISPLAIDGFFHTMDNTFNPYNIYINRLPINYIENSNYFNINSTTFNDLIQIDSNPNAINIYIVNYIAAAYGVADDTPSISLALRVQNNNGLHTTLIHEIGHCFGLHHTHETDFGIENIERNGSNANCSYAGDKLCSTPADPQLYIITSSGNDEYKVNQNCIYTAGETRNGLPYAPDTYNFMSYSRPHCLTSFTQEQGNVMHAMLQSNSILQPVVSDLCKMIGSSRICTFETYTVGNANNLPITWSVSPNLQILSSTNTSVTVEQKNSYQVGEGYIEAKVSSGTLRKEVWVGGPKLFTYNDDGSRNYMGTGYSFPVSNSTRTIEVYSESPDITTYTWDMYPTNIQWTSINNKAVFYINTPGNYLLTVEGTDQCDSQLMFFSIQIGSNNNLSIYPNPVTQGSMTVAINSPTPNTFNGGSSNQVKIYDLYGIEHFSNSYNTNNFTITGLSFEPGNYILNVTTTDGSVIQEIIIIE